MTTVLVLTFEGAANCARYQNARRGLGWALMVSSGGL